MNTCYNCLDRHIKNGKGSRTALIYDSPLSGKIEMYSYQNLQRLVSIYIACTCSMTVMKCRRD